MSADLAYLSELGEAMQKMRGNTWAVLVDMRGWVVPTSVSDSPIRPKLTLDRRNQKIEYWLVDASDQGEDLLPYFAQSGVKPKRFINPLDIYEALLGAGYILKGTKFQDLISPALPSVKDNSVKEDR